MAHSRRNDRILRSLERFLVGSEGSTGDLPPLDVLEESGLAAFASERAGNGTLRRALLAASARHLAIKAEVQRLLHAWQAQGIESLLFKGFHLAEFVYPAPGGRQYSDVDLLIEQKNALQAAAIAAELGWKETWHAHKSVGAHGQRSSRYHGHEVVQLLHPRIGVQLDVHRRLVHNNHNGLRRYGRQERITGMVWETSQRVEWGVVSVRLPHPLDAVLVGLVLNRCWSPEDFELRSHDYLDFRFLIEKYGLTHEQLRKRAEVLGCPRTLELFLERCDPFRRRCVLTAPTRFELQRWNLLIASERGNRYLERSWASALHWPLETLAILRYLPVVTRSLLRLRSQGGIEAAADSESWPTTAVRPLDGEAWRRMKRAVHRALRLLGYGRWLLRLPEGWSDRDVEAVVLLAALRANACPARLKWGRTSDGESRPLLLLEGKRLNVTGTLLSSRRSAGERWRAKGQGPLAG